MPALAFAAVGGLGDQAVQLDNARYGLYLHELGHVIGLAHEQSRADRDSVLNVNLENVPEFIWDSYRKWDQAEINTYDTPYDLQSVMQYGPMAFALDANKPAITVRDPALQHVLTEVNSKDISFWDARAINQHYECASAVILMSGALFGRKTEIVQTTSSTCCVFAPRAVTTALIRRSLERVETPTLPQLIAWTGRWMANVMQIQFG
ncbi:unnamed protein product [Dibothriocephalus latus]|uniref:Metalloendopeptidase n=1 Tax=Dibothriocephalus latus TaxID=60516 RepID=A0A3P7LKR5_DIBLA|nr:unnamed protein product [Dibothriocephalus latus]